jgi:hypothetical protein
LGVRRGLRASTSAASIAFFSLVAVCYGEPRRPTLVGSRVLFWRGGWQASRHCAVVALLGQMSYGLTYGAQIVLV